jgi:hypothetical protein
MTAAESPHGPLPYHLPALRPAAMNPVSTTALRSGQSSEEHPEGSFERKESLERRLAQGEISVEEYRQLVYALDEQPPE